ncbi:MAG: hypothetical protein RLO52_31990 [Sandaracinaceae bacterium]
MATYEMFWDCAPCWTQKLLGKPGEHCVIRHSPVAASGRLPP